MTVLKKKSLKLLCITLTAVLFTLNFTFLDIDALSNVIAYDIPEISMTMDIPSEIKIITQNVRQSDPIFAAGTFDYIQVMSKFRDNGDYYYGKDIKGTYEFEVVFTENEKKIDNLTKLSDKKQSLIIDSISQESDVTESSFNRINDTLFVKSSRSINSSDGRFFSMEYYTIYDGYDITIKITSGNDNLTDSEKEILFGIADSVRFPKERTINYANLFSVSEIVLFFLFMFAYAILVIIKIKNIKYEQYRAERKITRLKERMERDAREKEEALQAAQADKSTQTNQKGETSETVESNSDMVNTVSHSTPDKLNIQDYDIDLTKAISNFEESSEPRRGRKNNNTNKSKLPFGK